ncbi:MAG: hypothetical protein FWH14_03045 [Oscillospiraceae bacterium]|nr:hypothetical protein [Oscillospiraceae bacterium]
MNFSVGTGDPVSGTNVLATLTFDVTDPKEDEKYEITLIPHDGLSSLQTMVPHPSIAGLNVATNLDYTLVPYELEVVGAEPVSAEFVPPTTKSYVWGTDDALNLAGGKFVVTYDDDSKQDVDLTADMIDTDVTKIFDTIGTYTIEGKYTWGTAEQVATFKFVVSVVAPEKMFGPENLVVDDSGIKKNYVAGAKIDLTGLKVNLLIFAETGCTHDCKDKGEIDEDCTVCVTMELDGSAFRVIEPADGLAYVGMTKFTIALLGDDDVTYVVEGIEVEEEPEGETSTSETGSGTSTTSDTSDTPPGAGDTTMIALWIALALLSMAASVVVVKRRRRLN